MTKKKDSPATVVKPVKDQQPSGQRNTPAEDIEQSPLAPSDPRLRKSSSEPLSSNQDPLNGVNE